MSTSIKIAILTTTFLFSGILLAQPKKEEIKKNLEDASFNQKFEVGLNLVYDKVYIDALYVWEILLEEDPKNANLQYKAGMCQILLNNEAEALPYFDKAQYSVNKNYNPYSAAERNAPPEVLFYLARANHRNGSIDTAAYQYTFFIENVNKRHEKYKLGLLGQKQCENARMLIDNPKPYEISNVGSKINTSAPEYSPMITIDGSALFFTAKKLRPDSTNFEQISYENGQYFEDVYVSYKDRDGRWTDPQYLNFCSPRKNNASISSSPDGQEVFVYSDINSGDIYYSKLKDTIFESIQPYPAEELNTEYWESHATISNDGNYLYFVSNRPGGFGGRDIYRLKRLPNGEWSKAYNLGKTINTEFDEESPFLGVDNKTMYFSSNGPTSMGGFDIFITQIDEEEKWSTPENMGYPLNTVDDDIFYTTTADGRTGYYSSEKSDGQGDKDIYTVYIDNDYIQNIAILTGYINTSDGSRIPSGINITVKDLLDESKKQYVPRRRDGGYVLTLEPCHTYQIDYTLNDSVQFHETELYVPCNSSYQELKHELLLDMVSLESKRVLSEEDSLEIIRRSEEMVCDLVYKVQVGSFKKEIPDDYYKKYNPVSTELLGNNITRYMVGEFDGYILAERVKKEVEKEYPEAFVISYLNGKRIKTTLARDLEYGVVKCDENLYPLLEWHQDSVEQYTELIENPDFVYYFRYNKDKFNHRDPDFRVFVKGIKEIVDQDLPVTFYITSSASTVPTSQYKDNQDLAVHRLDNGKKSLIKLLGEFGVDISKINIVMKEASVNGPAYNNDAAKNEKLYRQYQYIKFAIQF